MYVEIILQQSLIPPHFVLITVVFNLVKTLPLLEDIVGIWIWGFFLTWGYPDDNFYAITDRFIYGNCQQLTKWLLHLLSAAQGFISRIYILKHKTQTRYRDESQPIFAKKFLILSHSLCREPKKNSNLENVIAYCHLNESIQSRGYMMKSSKFSSYI